VDLNDREGGGDLRSNAPGRGAVFDPNPRVTFGYRCCRLIFVGLLGAWFRPHVSGRERVPKDGPVIIAPVHRSFLDFGFAAFVTDRKLFFMAKDELWKSSLLGRLLLGLGAFPVHREAADREALRHAEGVLQHGQTLVLFPEGTRKAGTTIGELMEGAAFLAARTGATIVPVGIGGSDRAMPKGSRFPKPVRVRIAVGEPISAPEHNERGRVPRSRVHATTEVLHRRLQEAYDAARS
jgi:1-acyl-sn-glycerol-3-phosphate acyltransferase